MVESVGRNAPRLNLDIDQGATLDVTLTWKDENDALIDLTGYTGRMHIRLTQDAASFIHELTTENGGMVLGAAAGTVRIIISSADTTAFTFDDAVYDLELIAPSTAVTRLVEGCVTLYTEVTR